MKEKFNYTEFLTSPQGIASRNAEIIANMSALGFSIEQIVQVTGLSAKEVTEIARLGKN